MEPRPTVARPIRARSWLHALALGASVFIGAGAAPVPAAPEPAAAHAAPSATFDFTDTAGRRHTLEGYRGRWVLVNLWAPWCSPCAQEMPELSALYRDRGARDLAMIGVALDFDRADEVTAFVRRFEIAFPIVLGTDDKLGAAGPVRGLPTTVLFDRRGRPVWRRTGAVTRAQVEHYIGRTPAGAAP